MSGLRRKGSGTQGYPAPRSRPLLGTGHRGRLSTTFEETTRQSTAVVAFAAIDDCAEDLVVGERK